MTNEQTIIDFLEERSPAVLTLAEVIDLIGLIADSNNKGVLLNPAWLRATHTMYTPNYEEINIGPLPVE